MKKVYKILLLEDDSASATLVSATMERYNFRITLASDGRMGLSKLQEQKFDLVLCDIMMPHMDGLTFLEKAREMLKTTPVIMLTALGEKEMVIQAAQNNVSGYILKPISPITLFEKTRQALQLEENEIVDKKMLPFKISVVEKGGGEIQAVLFGCPGKGAVEEIAGEILKKIFSDRSFTYLKMEVREEFAYEPNSVDILNETLGRIMRQGKLKGENVKLSGKFFEYTDKVKLEQTEYISKCILP